MSDDSRQLTQEDVSRLYKEKRYADIEDARTSGRLAQLLGQAMPVPTDRQLTQQEVSQLYADKRYDAIESARTNGQLAELLGHTTTEGN